MALKAVVSSLDGVDEPLHDLYKQDDGGRFVLQVEGVDDMPAVRGLKAKNGELLEEVKGLKGTLSEYGGVTPAKIKELRDAAKSSGDERVQELSQKLEDAEAKLSQASQNAQREIETAKEKARKDQDAARNYFRRAEATAAISQHRGNPDLVRHIVESHLDVKRNDDGEFETRVVGKDGQPRIKDSAGNPFTPSDLVEEIKSDPRYEKAFDMRKGSDAPPGGGGSGGGGKRTISGRDPMEFGRNLEGIAKGEVTVEG